MKKSIHFILTILLISLFSCKTYQKQIEVDTLNHYTINEKGEKKYNLKLFIKEKIMENEIGENPLLQVNNFITPLQVLAPTPQAPLWLWAFRCKPSRRLGATKIIWF